MASCCRCGKRLKDCDCLVKEAVSKRQPFLCRDCNSPCSFEQTVTDENADGIVFNFDIYKCDKCGQKWSD